MEDAIRAIEDEWDGCCSEYPATQIIYDTTEAIERLPSAQPEPKRGKWIDKGEHGDWEWQADGRGRHWHEWECNTCHHYFAERSFFCPHCGSDMREVTNGN